MSHKTKYGNTYTDEEWQEMQDYFKQAQVNDDIITDKMAGLEKYLRRQLVESVGFTAEKQINTVVNLFRYFTWEEANIQFTSQERKNKLNDLWKRWNVAMDKVYNEAMSFDDSLETKRLIIMEKE